jgi:2-polyprenyl-3-methyl-5-hydroxy-6-metoxy-1,4-benzoquinol methylase
MYEFKVHESWCRVCRSGRPQRATLRSCEYVDRRDFISSYAAGKRVLDCGVVGLTCLDKSTRVEGITGSLHWQVASVAAEAVGIDSAAAVVEELHRLYPSLDLRIASVENIADDLADERPFELVILGDILEHLSNPGRALDSVRRVLLPAGEILITCPNSFGAPNYLRFLVGRYREGEDHVASFTKYTLGNLLRRHGFELVSVRTALDRQPESTARRTVYRTLAALLRRFPELGGTLLAVARPMTFRA